MTKKKERTLRERLSAHLAHRVVNKPIHTLMILGLITVFFSIGLAFIKLDATFKGMVGQNTPSFSQFIEVSQRFHITDNLILAFWHKDSIERSFAEWLSDANAIKQMLNTAIGANQEDPNKRFIKNIVVSENWGFSESKFVQKARQRSQASSNQQHQLPIDPDWDNPMFIMNIQPALDTENLITSMIFVPQVQALLEVYQNEHPNIQCVLGGFPAIANAEGENILNNFVLLFAFDFIIILIIFLIAYRRISFFFFCIIPLFLGIIWSLGLLGWIFQRANVMAIMAPIILFGLGISYSIHWGIRYSEIKAQSTSAKHYFQIVYQTFYSISSGLIISTLTSTGGFLILLFSSIAGFAEFGFVCAFGILSILTHVFYVLPILIVWQEKRFFSRNRSIITPPKASLWTFLVEKLGWNSSYDLGYLRVKPFRMLVSIIHSRWGLSLALLFFAVGITLSFWIPAVEFEKDALKIEPEHLDAIRLERRLDYQFGFTNYATLVMVSAPTGLELKEKLIRIRQFIMGNTKESMGSESHGEGLASIRIEYVHDLVGMGLSNLLKQVNWDYDPDSWGKARQDLELYRGGFKGKLTAEELEQLDFIVQQSLHKDPDGMIYTIMQIYPSQYIWDEDYLHAFIKDIVSIEKTFEATSAGLPMIWAEMANSLSRDLGWIMMLAVIMVFILLLSFQRSFKSVMITFLPVALSLSMVIGFIGITGMKINIMNMVPFPIILGLGIDYSVMLYQHIKTHGFKSIDESIAYTSKAIIIGAATDIVSIGSLILTNHPGMSMFGTVLTVGILGSLIGALFLSPWLIRLLYGTTVSLNR